MSLTVRRASSRRRSRIARSVSSRASRCAMRSRVARTASKHVHAPGPTSARKRALMRAVRRVQVAFVTNRATPRAGRQESVSALGSERSSCRDASVGLRASSSSTTSPSARAWAACASSAYPSFEHAGARVPAPGRGHDAQERGGRVPFGGAKSVLLAPGPVPDRARADAPLRRVRGRAPDGDYLPGRGHGHLRRGPGGDRRGRRRGLLLRRGPLAAGPRRAWPRPSAPRSPTWTMRDLHGMPRAGPGRRPRGRRAGRGAGRATARESLVADVDAARAARAGRRVGGRAGRPRRGDRHPVRGVRALRRGRRADPGHHPAAGLPDRGRRGQRHAHRPRRTPSLLAAARHRLRARLRGQRRRRRWTSTPCARAGTSERLAPEVDRIGERTADGPGRGRRRRRHPAGRGRADAPRRPAATTPGRWPRERRGSPARRSRSRTATRRRGARWSCRASRRWCA